jgi:hypothetical protein
VPVSAAGDVPSAVTLAEGDAAGTAGCGCGWTCAVAVPAMVMASAEAPQIAVLRLIMSFLPWVAGFGLPLCL